MWDFKKDTLCGRSICYVVNAYEHSLSLNSLTLAKLSLFFCADYAVVYESCDRMTYEINGVKSRNHIISEALLSL